ncbi:VOC family protein [Citreicella sp. C3M06]|uniref:VOC family protein n=1 Tax=Citreicella sp. C3M06 TaxID=2841564 RepID=UPI001C08BCE2|nr:VOC family protein [Citreicella sp. C3M06]MBU2961927.1 VOC family protein [Citreicella sp. C3M06]
MTPQLGRLVIYTRKTDAMVAFYSAHFGYEAVRLPGDRIVELRPPGQGAAILLHPASKGQRAGQSLIKLVFDVPDVSAACDAAKARGLEFGAIHDADGYSFANTKDPSGNSVQLSSRAYCGRAAPTEPGGTTSDDDI